MKKEIQKIIRKNRIMILIFLLIIGIFLIYYSETFSEYIPSKNYQIRFRISDQDNSIVILQKFILSYDFTKRAGNISFIIPTLNKKIDSIFFQVSGKIVDNASLIMMECNQNGLICKNYSNLGYNLSKQVYPASPPYSYFNLTSTNFYDFSQNLSNKKILINFLMADIPLPKGRFYFERDENNILHSDEEKGNIYLYLGKKYYCLENCINNFYNLEEHWTSSTGEFVLKLNNSNDQIISSFNINTGQNINFYQSLFLTIGTSLIFGVLFLFLETSFKNEKRN